MADLSQMRPMLQHVMGGGGAPPSSDAGKCLANALQMTNRPMRCPGASKILSGPVPLHPRCRQACVAWPGPVLRACVAWPCCVWSMAVLHVWSMATSGPLPVRAMQWLLLMLPHTQ